jgi:NADH-quinone oxidoreductase subunit A
MQPDYMQYVFAGVLVALSLVIAGAMLVASQAVGILMRVQKPTKEKNAPYECGMTPIGGARVRFSIKFYLVAVLFILFDIEAIFLYPWAVVHRWLGWFGLVEMLIFVAILVVGYVYIWKRGAFQWE